MFNIPDSLPPIIITVSDFVTIDRLISETADKDLPAIALYLERELERADVVAEKDLPSYIVRMNSDVTYFDSQTNSNHTATLVYPKDAETKPGTISLFTPVGAALIGMKVGNSITWYTSQGGEHTIKILAVS